MLGPPLFLIYPPVALSYCGTKPRMGDDVIDCAAIDHIGIPDRDDFPIRMIEVYSGLCRTYPKVRHHRSGMSHRVFVRHDKYKKRAVFSQKIAMATQAPLVDDIESPHNSVPSSPRPTGNSLPVIEDIVAEGKVEDREVKALCNCESFVIVI